MEDSEKNIKGKSRAMQFLYAGAFAMFCLITTLVIQIMMIAEQTLQAEVTAETVWDGYPQLVSVRTVFSECSNKASEDYIDSEYLTKDQCRQAAIDKARAEGLEEKANMAFQAYDARADELKKSIEEPWPLSVVSRSVMHMVGSLDKSK